MILPIVTYPNDILRQKATRISDPRSSATKALILDMLETMDASGNALGLAAPQVNQSVRLVIIKLDGTTHILINPKITYKSWKKETGEEGCLSFPGKFIPVKRHKKVTVKAQGKDGQAVTLRADGLLARALQHEIDHLDGILFIDRKK